MSHSGGAGFAFSAIAPVLAGVAIALDAESGLAVAAPLLAVGADDGFGLRGQVVWILASAALGGAAGYGIAALAAPTVTTIALGFGIAVGGGLGGIVRLLAFGETERQDPAEVTVSSATGAGTPDPQPVDLFEDHPDPVLYFDDSGDGPVVRAANDAFEETFGVGSEAVEHAGLADALMVTERAEEIVTAAREAEPFDAVLDCETAGDPRPFRVRTVAVARGSATRGYVLYTDDATAP